MVMPSAKQPPGPRMKPGFRSATICASSGFRPLGRFLKVFAGKSETKSSQTAPGDPNVSAKRAFGSAEVARSVAEYFFQGPAADSATGAGVADASTVPSRRSSEAVIRPIGASDRAKNDSLYSAPCETPMPQ